jgi:hypothetical protein
MKSVKYEPRIGKHFLNHFGKASPHINTHFLDLLTELKGLLFKHFNDIILLMTINHLNQFSGSSATRDTVEQSSIDENGCGIGSARLEAQTLTVQAVPP